MKVERQGDRVLFLTMPGERFKYLKWLWHSLVIVFRDAQQLRRARTKAKATSKVDRIAELERRVEELERKTGTLL